MREMNSANAKISLPKLICSGGIALAGMVTLPPAMADIFLRVQGIEGESKDRFHRNEIELLSYTQSYSRPPTVHTGGGQGSQKVTCGAIMLLKNIDKSSPEFIKAVTLGSHFPSAVITFRTVGAAQVEYYKVTLSEVEVTGVDQTDQPDPSKIVERIQLYARQYQYSYYLVSPQGTVGPVVQFGYDCERNTPM